MAAVAVAVLVASPLLHVPLFATRSAVLVPLVMAVILLSVPPSAAAMMVMLFMLFVLLYPTATVVTA